jgi:hypothetical protein
LFFRQNLTLFGRPAWFSRVFRKKDPPKHPPKILCARGLKSSFFWTFQKKPIKNAQTILSKGAIRGGYTQKVLKGCRIRVFPFEKVTCFLDFSCFQMDLLDPQKHPKCTAMAGKMGSIFA